MAIFDLGSSVFNILFGNWAAVTSILLVILVTCIWLYCQGSKRRLPPGPTYIPFIGNVFGFNLDGNNFSQLSKDYNSPIISVRLFGRLFIVLNDYDLIKEVFAKRPDLVDRPSSFNFINLVEENYHPEPLGLVSTSGRLWRDTRRFTVHMMRDFGMGKLAGEDNICHETSKAINAFKAHKGQPFDPHDIINMAVSNIINSIIFGKRFEYTDPRFITSLNGLNCFVSRLGKPVNFLLLTKPGKILLRSALTYLRKHYRLFADFVKEEIEDHKTTYKKGVVRDFIDAYMAEMETNEIFNDEQLQFTIQDLFLAGSETSYTTLRWALLYMAVHQDVQEKVQRELDSVIGPGRHPTMSDKKDTPYTEAVLCEVQRLNTLIQLAPGHSNSKEDMEILGYTVPRDACVTANLHAVHREKRFWKKPLEFYPENFLDEHGKVTNLDKLVQFSIGRRSCAGEALARMELYIFFASWLKSFHIKLEADDTVPDMTSVGYLRATLKQMGEAWEDILLEMDTKLIKFAQEKGASSGTVCNDFLELLMFGTPSDELHDFLLRDLTDKGLKKLGHSIETSYTNVQKLVLRQVQSCGQALLYHLGDLCSMAGWEEKFGVLGLDEVCLRAAVARVGSFMLKASELQHVIDDSLKNFKAFFRWLYVAILRLSDEAVPPELTKNTQQMYSFVAEFLDENFTLNETNDEDRSHGFKLERVGQYLKNKPLHNPPCCDDNPWIKCLAENPSIAGSELLYPVERDQSLIQAHDTLEAAIERCMKTPGEVLSMLFRCRAVVTVLESEFVDREQGSHSPKVAQFSVCNETGSYVYTLCMTKPAPVPTVCFFAHNTDSAPDDIQACTFKFTKLGNQDYSTSSAERCKEHKILDIAFYDAKTISVLLLEACDDGLAVLAQAPMAPLRDGTSARLLVETDTVQNVGRSSVSLSSLPCIEMGPHIQQMNCRKLENMKARALAVSGTRKVACVLFASVRRVRLYLMDVEDDDDECNETDADTTAHSGMDDSQQITDKSQNEEDKENTSYTSADTVDTST